MLYIQCHMIKRLWQFDDDIILTTRFADVTIQGSPMLSSAGDTSGATDICQEA